jgi:hypothetical protein
MTAENVYGARDALQKAYAERRLLTDRLAVSDGRATPNLAPDLIRRIHKVADMKTTFPMESHTSPAPGIIPEPSRVHDEPAASARRSNRRAAGTTIRPAARRTPLARLLAALHSDKYMVGGYPPAVSPTKEG